MTLTLKAGAIQYRDDISLGRSKGETGDCTQILRADGVIPARRAFAGSAKLVRRVHGRWETHLCHKA